MPKRCLQLLTAVLTFAAQATWADEPAVHVLVPGFRVERVPVKITNVNGLTFSPDGKLYTVCYDGKIRRLVDSDNDGIEDKVDIYWDKQPLTSPIAAAWGPGGLYVSSHLKISRLVDAENDGIADREEVFATGWPQIPSGSGLVDVMGLAFDKQGSLFIGVGCADFTNPYLVKDGKAQYDPKTELGAILKIAPDGKKREVFASGLRFTYALKFNKAGDLFATDQEGATWLEGANALDELNHIQPGRHYGWPPRHDQFLPKSIDEPPLVGFAPQHQSACGMVFNEETPGVKRLGPVRWEGNVFVAGYSRGKVWRVQLVKTDSGYVARSSVFACVDMLVADVAISPRGELYLACHSGLPDWGSGPQGEGVIYRISHEQPSVPQPVAAWPVGPLEVAVAFDAPLDPAVLSTATRQPIAFGEFVKAGDAFEKFKPPYKVVESQVAATKGSLRVASARLTDQGRTLHLLTDPHPWNASYALTVPGVRALNSNSQPAAVDVDYDLRGVDASWDDGDESKVAWRGWWPHLSPRVCFDLLRGSASHEACRENLTKPGTLRMQTMLSLPKGRITLHLTTTGAIDEATFGGAADGTIKPSSAELTAESDGRPLDFAIAVRTGAGAEGLALECSYSTGNDPTRRPIALGQCTVPWAPPVSSPTPPAKTLPPQFAGGDPVKGAAVFKSKEAKCSLCHKFRGEGAEIGPDLSNLPQKSAASVFRDIAEPSATINPDYVPFTVVLKDGRVAVGVVRSKDADTLQVVDTNAEMQTFARSEIEEFRPSATSIMPVGLAGAIGDAAIRDLIAYLMSPPAK